MTTASPTATRLDIDTCRALASNTKVVVADSDGQVVETVTVMRYGGFYRDSGTHTFAVRDPRNRFALRSATELGLIGDARRCTPADDSAIDLTDGALSRS